MSQFNLVKNFLILLPIPLTLITYRLLVRYPARQKQPLTGHTMFTIPIFTKIPVKDKELTLLGDANYLIATKIKSAFQVPLSQRGLKRT
ncbi:hypothetical protein FD30_GL001102 [Levilactobacillus namurensis DSM 19117]|uniref:Uncharacterized protein n=1 Tax=Levilactobacillus namurensis DSM 19117 TaxID=1423773 RepID=A0A0R1JMV7_9LACO|nr:hypothetical protein FD30_GL001102 [Levilactobacillus namurensis DSM 19117]